MPPSIDHLGFPHIVESILCETDWDTLLAARLVSASMCNFVDTLLPLERLTLSTSEAGEVCAHAWVPSERIKPRRALPFFCPGGSQASQHIAVHRADVLFVNAQLATAASVTLRHYMWRGQAGALPSLLPCDLALPPCQALTIDIGSLCACQSTGLFTHVASRVNLWIWGEGYAYASPGTSNCPVMSGVINLGVSQLTVSGNVLALPGLLGNVNVEASPTLHIRFEPDCALYPAEQTTLLADTHSLLNIPKGQITFA